MDNKAPGELRNGARQGSLRCIGVALVICSHSALATSGGEPQIINGSLSGAWPAVGLLTLDSTSICTGTAIAPQWVLTAAHCVKGVTSFTFTSARDINDPGAVFYTPDSWMIDPAYNDMELTIGHDIGLLHFPVPLPAMPLRLSDSRSLVHTGDRIALLGYGLDNTSNLGIKHIGFANISSLGNHIVEFDNGPANGCGGDSGGPTFVLGADGFPTLVGVMSYGSQNCTLTAADVVPDVLTFIQAAVPGVCLTSSIGAPCDGVFRDGFDPAP